MGKSTFIKKGTSYSSVYESNSIMTKGVDFSSKFLEINGIRIKLQIWLLGGKEQFHHVLPTYVRGSDGALFMYDVTNFSSLAHIDDWLTVIRKGLQAEDQLPIIVVGNKADLLDEREVTGNEGNEFAKWREVDGFIECSAKIGMNVEETFEAIARLMLQRSNLI